MNSKPRGKPGPAKKNRGGRPAVADADRRDTLVRVLTTGAEHAELQAAAARASMSVSSWVRSIALERARAMEAEKEAVGDPD
jgi:hypothetical protein